MLVALVLTTAVWVSAGGEAEERGVEKGSSASLAGGDAAGVGYCPIEGRGDVGDKGCFVGVLLLLLKLLLLLLPGAKRERVVRNDDRRFVDTFW